MSETPIAPTFTPLTGTSKNAKVLALILAFFCFMLGFALMDVVNDHV